MSARILSITLLLFVVCAQCSAISLRGPSKRAPSPCCTKASFVNVSAEVVRDTYRQQHAHSPCVNAFVFNMKNGQLACINPNAAWAKELTANMTRQ